MNTRIALTLVGVLVLVLVGPAVAQERGYDRIEAGARTEYTADCRAGLPYAVALTGDGDTDLDLYVYDPKGNLVDKDEDATDRALVVWNARVDGKYTIVVVNLGTVWNRYYLIYK